MKKIISGLLVASLVVTNVAGSASAASQTAILKPTKADLGVTYVYLNGSQTPDLISGGGGTDLNNSLAEDGQFALLDPQLPGPGQFNANSILALDYEKNTICSGATIQDVKVHVIWKASELSTQGNDLAALIKTDNSSANPKTSVAIDTNLGQVDYMNEMYGGVVSSAQLQGGTFSANVPTTLTHDSSSTQLPVTLNDLNDPDSRVMISMGDGGDGDVIQISGMVDYAYLEVTYDDSSCIPNGVTDSNIKAPKTGALLTVTIILTALAAGLISAVFGTRRTKLKHRASERE